MFTIKLADINIEIDNKYDYIYKQCKDYLTDEPSNVKISCSKEDILAENESAEYNYSKGYLESLAIYRKICEKIADFNAYLLHSATVEVGGYAYSFMCASGGGKTTHISIWKKLLGDKMTIINGDKPIYKIIDGEIYVYGTPWAGKENYNTNTKAKVKAFCIVNKSLKNSISELSVDSALDLVMRQIYFPHDPIACVKVLDLFDKTMNSVKLYSLDCNMELDAGKVSYNKMTGENI